MPVGQLIVIFEISRLLVLLLASPTPSRPHATPVAIGRVNPPVRGQTSHPQLRCGRS